MPLKLIIICGPTASGKTNFAHQLALYHGGEIVNSDAMQLYQDLEIITASPSECLQQQLPYYLYNFQTIDQELSAASYAERAAETILAINSRGKLPILVGGSGMYIKMLINGYSNIPQIKLEVRAAARKLHQELGNERFVQELNKLDHGITQILSINDTQRIIRAYEVVKQTGKSILYFQQNHHRHLLVNCQFYQILLMPERQLLYELCQTRLHNLFKHGAIEEIAKLLKKWGNISSTATKALGVQEITQYLQNQISLDAALKETNIRTRQYAKRQVTWFKNQLKPNQIINFDSIKQYQQRTEKLIIKKNFFD